MGVALWVWPMTIDGCLSFRKATLFSCPKKLFMVDEKDITMKFKVIVFFASQIFIARIANIYS